MKKVIGWVVLICLIPFIFSLIGGFMMFLIALVIEFGLAYTVFILFKAGEWAGVFELLEEDIS